MSANEMVDKFIDTSNKIGKLNNATLIRKIQEKIIYQKV